jgi:hypothetical protein
MEDTTKAVIGLTSLAIARTTPSTIFLEWDSEAGTTQLVGYRIHYQKVASTYIQYSSMLLPTTTDYNIKNLVADTYYRVCLVVYHNDTIPVRECLDAATSTWHIPVSIGSSIGAILALSMIVLVVLLSRCPMLLKYRRQKNAKQEIVVEKFNDMSSRYHDDMYEFSDTGGTHGGGHEDENGDEIGNNFTLDLTTPLQKRFMTSTSTAANKPPDKGGQGNAFSSSPRQSGPGHGGRHHGQRHHSYHGHHHVLSHTASDSQLISNSYPHQPLKASSLRRPPPPGGYPDINLTLPPPIRGGFSSSSSSRERDKHHPHPEDGMEACSGRERQKQAPIPASQNPEREQGMEACAAGHDEYLRNQACALVSGSREHELLKRHQQQHAWSNKQIRQQASSGLSSGHQATSLSKSDQIRNSKQTLGLSSAQAASLSKSDQGSNPSSGGLSTSFVPKSDQSRKEAAAAARHALQSLHAHSASFDTPGTAHRQKQGLHFLLSQTVSDPYKVRHKLTASSRDDEMQAAGSGSRLSREPIELVSRSSVPHEQVVTMTDSYHMEEHNV